MTDLYASVTGVVVAIMGLSAISVGIASRDPSYIAGAVLLPIGTQLLLYRRVLGVVRDSAAPTNAAFEKGYQMGLNKGYHDGRRAARPVVVPLRADCAERQFFSS